MAVLITGGCGFIGSNLAKQLRASNFEVHILDNLTFGTPSNLHDVNSYTLTIDDIRSKNISSCFAGIETVFHFAGIAALPACEADALEAFDINVNGTINIIQLCRSNNVKRLIFSSTSAVYENSNSIPHQENDSVLPDLVYSVSKLCAEHCCRSASMNYNLDIIICRFFNVYGPNQDIHRPCPPLTSYLAVELARGNVPVLYNSRLDNKRDYIYISDVCAILKKMMLSQGRFKADVFNVGTGVAHNVQEIFDLLKQISGQDIIPQYKEPQNIWGNYPSLFTGLYPLSPDRVTQEVYKTSIANIDKTCAAFDWIPLVSLENGLKKLYEYTFNEISALHKEE